ncbi:UNVERIFIED_CONTAM: hypothetical protein HDU68_005837 [Siphonaria sp. JEL0065]|nr:hypothetical protein HDU68_005837 [Siphonaria sp. JEL0065]
MQEGIDVVVVIGDAPSQPLAFIEERIIKADARYIILMTGPSVTTKIYFGLAVRARIVGPEYVWISLNSPMTTSNGVELFGKDYFKHARGLMVIWNVNPATPEIMNRINKFLDKVEEAQAPWGFSFTYDVAYNYFSMFQAYDCIGLFAHGFDNLLRSGFSANSLSERKLQGYMNYTLFKDTNYYGLTGDPVVLTRNGDVAA